MYINITVVSLVCLICLNYAYAYRILCPFPANSRSHFIVAEALLKGLAAKGHDVTVISAFPPEKPIPNYRHITLELRTSHDELMKVFTKKPGEMGISFDLLKSLAEVTVNESYGMLMNPHVQKIMLEETFDLVIVEFLGEPFFGLSAHFNCPLIVLSSIKPTYRFLELMGNPLSISYVKNSLYTSGDLNKFSDRVLNVLFYLFEKLANAYFTSHYTAFHDAHFPAPKYPSHTEILENNIAAWFVTHHFSQGDVRPLVPGIIEISGIQMTETATPLPSALQQWMDQSTNGVVYFSFGSNFKISTLESAKLEALIKVFKQLKLNVLWKSDITTIAVLPANVRLEKWVSQVDVLQHKNTKLFITHGGLGSVTESKFYGIPVLVVPMFADQIPNAIVVEKEGWGIKLPYAEFSEKQFHDSVNELIENPIYYDKAKYESMLYRDRPMTPLETGIFWVEYVIRHKGARHMRSNAIHLNWFQLNSLDVIGFLLVVLILWAYITLKVVKFVWKKLCGAKKTKLKLG